MRALDEDALFCDFAEYYRIYDWDALPLRKQAVLACGLPASSRIMKASAKMDYDFNTLLLAALLDQERVANWRHTKDAKHKRNFPKSILDALLHTGDVKKDEVQAFDSAEEFNRRRERLICGG